MLRTKTNMLLAVSLTGTMIFANSAPAIAGDGVPRFEFLGDSSDSPFVGGISADGSVVSGSLNTEPNRREAFRWTAAGGFEFPGIYTGIIDGELKPGPARISPNGEWLAGVLFSYEFTERGWISTVRAYRWSATTGFELLPVHPLAFGLEADARAVTNDGVVYGTADGPTGRAATQWVDGVPYLLTDTFGDPAIGQAVAVSDNGQRVAGSMGNIYSTIAARWVNGEPALLGVLPGGTWSVAHGISGNGRYIVGDSGVMEGSVDRQAFRWSADDGIVGLGYLPGFRRDTRALAVTNDGKYVVGGTWHQFGSPEGAFVWDEANGIRLLQDVLETDYGLNLDGFQPDEATEVVRDPDGDLVVAGLGLVDGRTQSWIAYLPDPPCGPCADSNCDGAVTVTDVNFFVAAITGGAADWIAAHNGTLPCNFRCANDTNADGTVSVSDINAFVDAVSTGACD